MTQKTGFPSDDDVLDYVAGRASPEAAERIEAVARDNPDLAADIALMRGAKAALADSKTDNPPGALGWARLERELDRMPATATNRWPVWQVAAASAVAAVALWQFAVAPMVMPSQGGYVTATGSVRQYTATVAFEPDATEAQIRALLIETGATVIGGPSALGLWQLGFADNVARDAALERLRAAGSVVESVQVE